MKLTEAQVSTLLQWEKVGRRWMSRRNDHGAITADGDHIPWKHETRNMRRLRELSLIEESRVGGYPLYRITEKGLLTAERYRLGMFRVQRKGDH